MLDRNKNLWIEEFEKLMNPLNNNFFFELDLVAMKEKIKIPTRKEAIENSNWLCKNSFVQTPLDSHLYDGLEIVDVDYVDRINVDSNIIIIADKQKLRNSPLKYLDDVLNELDHPFLRENFSYKSFTAREYKEAGIKAREFLNFILVSKNKDWFLAYLDAIVISQGGTAHSMTYSIREDIFEAYPENNEAWHRRAIRLLNSLVSLKILSVKKIPTARKRAANFYWIPDGDQEVIHSKEIMASTGALKTPAEPTVEKSVKSKPILTCYQCKKSWTQKKDTPPKQCAKCGSRRWNDKPVIERATSIQTTLPPPQPSLTNVIKEYTGLDIRRCRRYEKQIVKQYPRWSLDRCIQFVITNAEYIKRWD